MTMLFMDGFDHYGSGATVAAMLNGVWAANDQTTIGAPAWGLLPTGGLAISTSQGSLLRKVFDWGAMTALLIGVRVGMDNLPPTSSDDSIVDFRDGDNASLFRLYIDSTGVLTLRDKRDDQNNRVVSQTQTPVLVAQSWQFVEMEIDTVADTFQLDVDGVTVMNASVCGFTSASIAQLGVGTIDPGTGSVDLWLDDFTIRSTDGTHNNTFEGDLRVATLFVNADGPNQGWTPQYRHKLGTGILDLTASDNRPGIYCANSASLDCGPGDFTLEGFFRFAALPAGGNKAVLFSKWDETNNRRSYQVYLGGPTLESGNIVFRTSTDGTAATVVEKISYPWPGSAPDLDTWYHIAVVRASGELLLFINGQQYGLPIADTDTYFVGTEPYSTGVQIQDTTTNVNNTNFTGWVDELRLTMGYARYTANFTPTTVPFPRNVGGDPEFADVVLLCGFDSGINDSSSFARAVNSSQGAAAVTPDDGAAAWQTLAHHTPQDDTFIEAALLPASNILTLSAQPTVNDTVTVGTYTDSGSQPAVYKFVAAAANPFEITIGAAISDTLFNLRSAINLVAGAGTLYGTGTIVNDDVTALGLPGDQMGVGANIAGTVGNTIASTSSLTQAGDGWDGATLSGGADIPGNSDFYFDRPPVNTTIIKAAQIMTRSFKTDAGSGSLQTTFVGPLGGTLDGADNALTLAPTYRWDIYETDPDTGASITPATVVGGRVRVNRTE